MWGSINGFDVNGASPALLEALGLAPTQVQQILTQRTTKPFANINEVASLGIPVTRLRVGMNSMWTMRATARLRRPDGTPSDVVRSASATVKYWRDPSKHPMPVQVVRYYEDAWSEFAIKPLATQAGVTLP